ncbi:D-beta-hydroxybutyrate dehydrogenase, mitochondrial-like [Ptychodera flava]|uniref:D-beta-hydroxybutyrate dehydrogenase, mitochondrial-like n=1 Tax=Ptychodera flava TaxID=63121 RepID=UPI00396A3B52
MKKALVLGFAIASICVLAFADVRITSSQCLDKTCLTVAILSVSLIILWLIPREKISIEGKAVFISGCDTGFGHKLAKRLDSLGMVVFAGCLKGDGEGAKDLVEHCSERLRIVVVDVTSDESVRIARKVVEENLLRLHEGIWAIVNNAGIWTWGEVEWCKIETYKRLAEVNTYGVVRVTQAFLPLIRRAKGRVVNVTSQAGLWTPPAGAMYGMSKYAAESLSDALRHEMYPWGVKVSMIEPGYYARSTKISHNVPELFKQLSEELWDGMTDECKKDYGKEYHDTHYRFLCEQVKTTIADNTPVIDAMVDAILAKEPKHRYLVGGFFETVVIAHLHRLLPSWIMDRRFHQYYASFPVPAALKGKN